MIIVDDIAVILSLSPCTCTPIGKTSFVVGPYHNILLDRLHLLEKTKNLLRETLLNPSPIVITEILITYRIIPLKSLI
jgi:hypothetical protein